VPEYPISAPALTGFSSANDTNFLPVFANLGTCMLKATLPLAGRPVNSAGYRIFRLVFLGACAVLAAFIVLKAESRAEESRTLIIPPNDGYGLEECLKTGSTCGFVVADAWCKAHGFAGSKEFGPADETASTADAPPGSFHVTCGGEVN
jgi:hypothetical protein